MVRKAVVLVLVSVLAWLVCGGETPAAARARAAREVEARLLAPCCWIQTLDVHRSELADELRAEVALRLDAGEAPAAIEDALALRYGARIRAVPRDVSSRALGVPFVIAGVIGVLILWLLAKRLVKRPPRGAGAHAGAAAALDEGDRDRDELLDAELLEMD